MSHIDQSAFRRIADSLPTPTASIAPTEPLCACKDRPASRCTEEWGPGCDLGNNAAHVKVSDVDPAVIDSALAAPKAEGEAVSGAAPVAQAAAGASDDTRRLDWMESGAWIPVQTMLEMNWSNREQTRKYRIGEEGPWSATLREAVDKASDFRPPRPEADADRASGGGV